MIRIGIIGYGFMGQTHAQAYSADPRAVVVAIADPRPDLASTAVGNIEAAGDAPVDLSGVYISRDAEEVLARDDVDAISICTPTPTHVSLTEMAVRYRKHALIEKPLALTSQEAMRVATAADGVGLCIMPAMCMRFWPGWVWLKDTIESGTYGSVLSAVFTRRGARPGWGQGFYASPDQCGGAILDLHVHDVDFIRWCFGDPAAISAVGIDGVKGGVDHVVATFDYGSTGPMIVAEGGWIRAGAVPFTMRYLVEFEQATASFDLAQTPALSVYSSAGCSHPEIPAGDGYRGEVKSFLDCIESGSVPAVTPDDAVRAIRLIEAERESIINRAWIRGF